MSLCRHFIEGFEKALTAANGFLQVLVWSLCGQLALLRL
jgi:hypothetical protein